MMERLPPLSALRAFEAVARHLSVKDAAEELNVTSGAVSLQIRNLEEVLGVTLFLRRPRSIALSPQGQRYYLSVSAAFRVLKDATHALRDVRDSSITLSCTQGFAMQWLLPRLDAFTAIAPGVDVRISISERLVDFEREDIDFAVRHGLGRYAGLQSEKLIDDGLVPVASPSLLDGKAQPSEPDDLRHHVLLHDEHREDWKVWLATVGAKRVNAATGPVFTGNGVVEAVLAGRGVALLRESFIRTELKKRRLVKLFPKKLKVDFAYHLVYRRDTLARREAELFRNWILEQRSA